MAPFGGVGSGAVNSESSPEWCTPGSIGPGPGTTTVADGNGGRGSGIRTVRECRFNAGLSDSAFPTAFLMNV